jgi:hypothetical protein
VRRIPGEGAGRVGARCFGGCDRARRRPGAVGGPVQVSLPHQREVPGSLAIGADVLVLLSTPDTVPGTL